MEKKEEEKMKVFAESLANLRAVNLFVIPKDSLVNIQTTLGVPVLNVKSNLIELPMLGDAKIVLDGINIRDCSLLKPRTLDGRRNAMIYRLIVEPLGSSGSAAAEIIPDVGKLIDEGSKNLVKNSINNVALKEGSPYWVKCRFCSSPLSDVMKFDRIRPLPSNNWVEHAHELWYCHPPELNQAQGLSQDVAARLNKVSLGDAASNSSTTSSIVELLKNPDVAYCFYGPCNWAVHKTNANGICLSDEVADTFVRKAVCRNCKNELGSFTSESCVKFWDYAVEWVDKPQVVGNPLSSMISSPLNSPQAELNFKSIVFATIYELSDHPTFRFNVSSTCKGNSIFLWIIDKNLSIYQSNEIPIKSSITVKVKPQKVAKFFFAVTKNNILPIVDPKEVQIIRESELNKENILIVPDPVFKAGVKCLERSSFVYSRPTQALQCGYLVFDV